MQIIAKTEEAFLFYKSFIGAEFIGNIVRFGVIPPSDDMPPTIVSKRII